MTITMQINYLKLDQIKQYENNPRKIPDKAINIVAKSITEFGFKNPIIIDKNNIIIAGHTRLKAAESLGLKEVPTILADDLTEKQIQAFRLVDNKTHEYSDWDMDKLNEELLNIRDDFNIEEFDFDLFENIESKELTEFDKEDNKISFTIKFDNLEVYEKFNNNLKVLVEKYNKSEAEIIYNAIKNI